MFKLLVRSRRSGEQSAVLRNVSETGLSLRVSSPLQVGDSLDVELPACGWIGGTIRWANGLQVGFAFDDPIDPAMVLSKPVESMPKAPVRPIYAHVLLEHIGSSKRPAIKSH